MNITEKILNSRNNGRLLAVLVDPDRNKQKDLSNIIHHSLKAKIDFFLVGGSIVFSSFEETILFLKENSSLPVVIFPGNALQISDKADGLLFISLISGRNPEFLIGHQVLAAPAIKLSGISTIPVGYILIENGRITSVQYMSNTTPIPADKPEIIVATAMAGELLGLKAIYLEAGSGATHTVGLQVIREVRKNINLPLIVGGGIRSKDEAVEIYRAGADIVVAGNATEDDPSVIYQLTAARDLFT